MTCVTNHTFRIALFHKIDITFVPWRTPYEGHLRNGASSYAFFVMKTFGPFRTSYAGDIAQSDGIIFTATLLIALQNRIDHCKETRYYPHNEGVLRPNEHAQEFRKTVKMNLVHFTFMEFSIVPTLNGASISRIPFPNRLGTTPIDRIQHCNQREQPVSLFPQDLPCKILIITTHIRRSK
jgi:hypothetical protein